MSKLFERVRDGSFAVTYPNGDTENYGEGEPQFRVRFRDDSVFDLVGEIS